MHKLSPLYVIGLATLSGVTSGLAVHSDHFWVFGIIGLTGLMAAWRCAGSARTALFAGWAGGFAYFASSLEFLLAGYHSIGMSGLQPLLGVSALYALLCIWWGPVFYVSHRIDRWVGIFGLVFLWFGSEMLRAFIAPAIPPSFFGDFWSKTPVIQAVSVIGIEGLSFLTLLAAGLVCRDLGRKPFPIVPFLIFAVLWKAGAGHRGWSPRTVQRPTRGDHQYRSCAGSTMEPRHFGRLHHGPCIAQSVGMNDDCRYDDRTSLQWTCRDRFNRRHGRHLSQSVSLPVHQIYPLRGHLCGICLALAPFQHRR